MDSRGDDRLTRLVEQHAGAVGDYLRRRLFPLDGSDLDLLVAETFVIVWRRITVVPDGEGERPWIIGVARHVLQNAQRSTRRRRSYEDRVRSRMTAASAEEGVVARDRVRSALARLSPADREILQLSAWDGLDATAIAAVLDITTNAAAVRLSRATGRFRAALEDPDTISVNRTGGGESDE